MEITPYDFSGKTVRILTDGDGNPWWVAKDVCCVLGLANPRQVISVLDDDEKDDVHISDAIGRKQNTNIINEPGLYRLLSRSNKKRAKKFQRWVFHDVLPTIRKTGSYSADIPKTLPDALRAYAIAIEAKEKLLIENKKLKPKAEAYKQVSDSTGLTGISDTGKIIGLPPHTFSGFLIKDGYCFIRKRKIVPYQPYIDNNWFKLKLVPARDGSTSTYRQTFITPRGVNAFREIYNPRQLDLFT